MKASWRPSRRSAPSPSPFPRILSSAAPRRSELASARSSADDGSFTLTSLSMRSSTSSARLCSFVTFAASTSPSSARAPDDDVDARADDLERRMVCVASARSCPWSVPALSVTSRRGLGGGSTAFVMSAVLAIHHSRRPEVSRAPSRDPSASAERPLYIGFQIDKVGDCIS